MPLKSSKSQSKYYGTWLSKLLGLLIFVGYLSLVVQVMMKIGKITDLDEDVVPYKKNAEVADAFNTIRLVNFNGTNNDVV